MRLFSVANVQLDASGYERLLLHSGRDRASCKSGKAKRAAEAVRIGHVSYDDFRRPPFRKGENIVKNGDDDACA